MDWAMESSAQKITSDEKLLHGILTYLRRNGAEERGKGEDEQTENKRNIEPRGKHFPLNSLKVNGKYVCHLLPCSTSRHLDHIEYLLVRTVNNCYFPNTISK
jgi:hypothetical protein